MPGLFFVPSNAMEEHCINSYLPLIEEYRPDQQPICFLSERKSEDGGNIKIRCLDGDVIISAQMDRCLIASHEVYNTLHGQDKKHATQKKSFHNMRVPVSREAFLQAAQYIDGQADVLPSYKLIEGLDYFGYQVNLTHLYTPHDLHALYDKSEEKEKKEIIKNFLALMGIVLNDANSFVFQSDIEPSNSNIHQLTASFSGPANTIYVPFEPLVTSIKKMPVSHLRKLRLSNLPPVSKENNLFPKILKAIPSLAVLTVENSCIPIIPKGTFVELPENFLLSMINSKITTIEKGAFAPINGIGVDLSGNPLTVESKKNLIADTQTFTRLHYLSHMMKFVGKMRLQELLGNNELKPGCPFYRTTYRATLSNFCLPSLGILVYAYLLGRSIPKIISELYALKFKVVFSTLISFNTVKYFADNYRYMRLPQVYFDEQDAH